jgi:hypothetical protein
MTTTSDRRRQRSLRHRSAANPIPRSGWLRKVEREARRLLIGNVDHYDICQFLDGNRPGNRRADVPGATDTVTLRFIAPHMFSIIASANCDVLSSVAPSINRARS